MQIVSVSSFFTAYFFLSNKYNLSKHTTDMSLHVTLDTGEEEPPREEARGQILKLNQLLLKSLWQLFVFAQIHILHILCLTLGENGRRG